MKLKVQNISILKRRFLYISIFSVVIRMIRGLCYNTTMQKEVKSLNRKFEMFNGRVRLENSWIKVIDYDTRTDGRDGLYTVVERKDVAIVILEHAERGILLMNSYRYPIRSTSWELPMGGVEEDESPSVAATREMEEEIGRSVTLRQIGEFLPIPGLTPQRAYVFYGEVSDDIAEQITQFNQLVDEIIDRRFVTRDELKNMIRTQKFQEGLSLAALAIFGLD